ncbi:MAG: hypothetical protein AB8F94_01960 [Saprospiraceae bacterium]
MFFLIGFFTSCHEQVEETIDLEDFKLKGKGVLLTTRFSSFDDFKKEVQIEYSEDEKSWVRLTQVSNGQTLSSVLKSGIKESDILKVRDGGFLGKVKLGLRSPFFVMNRKDILKSFLLSRRRSVFFGGGDVAFYDIALTMMNNIDELDLESIPGKDLSEKGFINTFNHANSQAFITALFSEELADFIADTHERSNMPELLHGKFTKEQLEDIKNGPVDNYIDIINNEWGQELGKLLKRKYKINQELIWTPELLTKVLNDLQSYYSWVFQIEFKSYKITDEVVLKFVRKLNRVNGDLSGMR